MGFHPHADMPESRSKTNCVTPFLDFRTLAALLATVLLWASAFPAMRAVLQAYSPEHLALLRFGVASAVLGLYAAAVRLRLPARADLPGVLACGLLGVTVYHLALCFGQARVTAGSASILVNSGPVFTALLATLFLGDRLGARGWAGIGVSFAGVVLIALGEGKGFRLSAGALLILLAALAMSCYTVIQKPFLQRYRPLEFSAYSIWGGTLLMLPFAAAGLPEAVARAPLSLTLTGVYLGIFPAALAYITWTYLLSRLPAARAASLLYLVPPLAMLMAWILLREVPPALSLVGGAVALTGVALTSLQRNPGIQAAPGGVPNVPATALHGPYVSQATED